MPYLDIPVIAAGDELLRQVRVGGYFEDWSEVAEVAVQVLLGVAGGAAVDRAGHGGAVVDVGVVAVEVDG